MPQMIVACAFFFGKAIFFTFLKSEIDTFSSVTPLQNENKLSGLRERIDNFQIFPTVTDFFFIQECVCELHKQL